MCKRSIVINITNGFANKKHDISQGNNFILTVVVLQTLKRQQECDTCKKEKKRCMATVH